MNKSLDAFIIMIKEIIIEGLEYDVDPEDIEDEEMLMGGQLGLDSISTLVLVEALEDEFDIEVEDEELTLELFESVKSLAEYAQKKVQRSIVVED